jgi:hypothetical protein
VLDALRGRAAAGRSLLDSARRTLTELGMRHALLEVDQFAGILELVADDPAAAEPHLRRAYNGFRRMGLDADTAETGALLARACLALDWDAKPTIVTESERLAGHALKASIAWRTVRAQLLARSGVHDEARRVAEEAVAVAERTDLLVDHGDACLGLATVLGIAGDNAGAWAAANKAVGLYELKGAAALAEKARTVLGGRDLARAPTTPEAPSVETDNACVQAGTRLIDAVNREAWGDVEQLLAPYVSVESRRKIVGFPRIDIPSSGPRILGVFLRRAWCATATRLSPWRASCPSQVALPTPGLERRKRQFLQLYGMNGRVRVICTVVRPRDVDARWPARCRAPARGPGFDTAQERRESGRAVERAVCRQPLGRNQCMFADDMRLDDRRQDSAVKHRQRRSVAGFGHRPRG